MTRTSHPNLSPDDKKCYKCKKDHPNKILKKCKKCSKVTHFKCDKSTKAEIAHFEKHPEDFECKSCSTCRICNRYVGSTHRGIECELCKHWTHAKCNKLCDKDYDKYQTDETLKLHCMQCLAETLHTLKLTDQELKLTMDGIDLPEKLTNEDILLDNSQQELIERINKTIRDA